MDEILAFHIYLKVLYYYFNDVVSTKRGTVLLFAVAAITGS